MRRCQIEMGPIGEFLRYRLLALMVVKNDGSDTLYSARVGYRYNEFSRRTLAIYPRTIMLGVKNS